MRSPEGLGLCTQVGLGKAAEVLRKETVLCCLTASPASLASWRQGPVLSCYEKCRGKVSYLSSYRLGPAIPAMSP